MLIEPAFVTNAKRRASLTRSSTSRSKQLQPPATSYMSSGTGRNRTKPDTGCRSSRLYRGKGSARWREILQRTFFYGIITAENWALAQFTPPMAGPTRRTPRAAPVTPEPKSSIKRFERRFRGAQARWACRYGIITAENWALAQFTPPMAGPARGPPRAAPFPPKPKPSIRKL